MDWCHAGNRKSGGKPPHSKLAAGDGDHVALRANSAGGGGEFLVAGFDGLREVEERRGVDGSDGTPMGESNGNLRRGDVVREFGDGEEVEAAGGEKCGVDGAAEFFDGSANHSEAVLWVVRQMAPRLIGETNLEAVVGHCGLDSGGGPSGLGI